MTGPQQQAQQAIGQAVGAGLTLDAQVHDAWSQVQNLFGAWGRGTYGLFASIAAFTRGQRT